MLPTSGSKGGEALTHWRDCGNEEEEEEEEEKEETEQVVYTNNSNGDFINFSATLIMVDIIPQL